ncbi:MAG: type IV pilus twitching motility protein PilT [Christensenellaceae bacterium]
MDSIFELIRYAKEHKASDLHITVGKPPVVRIDGELVDVPACEVITPDESKRLISLILGEKQEQELLSQRDTDFAYSVDGLRLRINVYMQKGYRACAIRLLADKIPTLDELAHPPILKTLSMLNRGLVLLTGPTGSGKSTTLAAMIDYINVNKTAHIITVEDPIEYVHAHKSCVINQRELGEDTHSFEGALRACLREDPDIILVGEMRDLETVKAAITAAETGHLVLSTLHTMGAANTIDRIIDIFPPSQQHQIRIQLADTLQGVITQQLLPCASGEGRIAALEIMTKTDAISNLIREGKTHQIPNSMQTGRAMGMQSMDVALGALVKEGKISVEQAKKRCVNEMELKRYI